MKECNGYGIPIFKPRSQDVLKKLIEKAEKLNCKAVGVDLDGCGSTIMAKHGMPVFKKSVKDIEELVGYSSLPFIAKGIMLPDEAQNGLNNFSIAGVQKVQKINAKNFSKTLHGKTGIIFFKDYWQRTINGKLESVRNRSGDHIDLWNKSKLTDWKSWARIHIRIGSIGLHTLVSGWSDLEDSKSIWFWRVL